LEPAQGQCDGSVGATIGEGYLVLGGQPLRLASGPIDHIGAGIGCKVLLRKREGTDEMHIEKHKPRGGLGVDESEKMATKSLQYADRLLKSVNLVKLNNEHLAGQHDNVTYSKLLDGLAKAEFPDDKRYMAKFEERHREEFGRKAAADNKKQQQQTALGNGYSRPLGAGPAWDGAVGSGVGTAPRVQGNTYSGSAVDAQFSASPFANAGSAVDASKRYAGAITKDNIDVLMKRFGLSFGQAATMLARGVK
jgi:hypothetical protein